MAPQRFASARVKSRPSRGRPSATTRAWSRCAMSRRCRRGLPSPSSRCGTPARTAGRPFSSAPSSPVVIVPPAVPPALEQHPALRSARPVADEWKRDSGLAPTTSTVTIPEEDEDEDDNDDADSAAARQSELGAADPPDDPVVRHWLARRNAPAAVAADRVRPALQRRQRQPAPGTAFAHDARQRGEPQTGAQLQLQVQSVDDVAPAEDKQRRAGRLVRARRLRVAQIA